MHERGNGAAARAAVRNGHRIEVSWSLCRHAGARVRTGRAEGEGCGQTGVEASDAREVLSPGVGGVKVALNRHADACAQRGGIGAWCLWE